ncbi:hypothetical protein D9M68_899590 [compost metagenome]
MGQPVALALATEHMQPGLAGRGLAPTPFFLEAAHANERAPTALIGVDHHGAGGGDALPVAGSAGLGREQRLDHLIDGKGRDLGHGDVAQLLDDLRQIAAFAAVAQVAGGGVGKGLPIAGGCRK